MTPKKIRLEKYGRAEDGFSLLEVLVSIVIVTMGLLALAGMSVRSLAANDSSGLRANAAVQALYISDLMRANRQPVVDGGYDVAIGSVSPGAGSNPQSVRDVADWKALLASLPSGDGDIAYNAATQLVTVRVRWDDNRGNVASGESVAPRIYEYSFRP